MASSSLYFYGSLLSRVVNPVSQDVRFNNKKTSLTSPTPPYSPSLKGEGCMKVKFGQKLVAVRIKGFNFLRRDNRNCNISVVA
ncbi:hypothetical protein V6N13_016800 [Hibiscus sabdariffa]|uniref:Uncharacterized protein n=1 Tax=Hibiscus sabdariffa TaxID=183260 RepID=A0ABR2PU15_9ROSI